MELFNHAVERQCIRVIADASLGDPKRALVLAQQNALEPCLMHQAANHDTFQETLSLSGQGRPADLVSLWAGLQDCESVAAIGGQRWLHELFTADVDAWEHALPTYAKTLQDLALRRSVREQCARLARQCDDPEASITQVLTSATGDFAKLTRQTGSLRTVQESLIDSVMLELENKGRAESERVIPTGMPSLDSLIGGLQRTLIVVLAQAGVGKSAFLATLAQSVAARGNRVGVFSLEDDGDWLTWRLLACESRVNQFAMRYRALSKEQLERISSASGRVSNYGARIVLDDRPGLTPEDVVQSAREMILVRGCEAIILDHLGEVVLGNKRRERFDLELDDALRQLRDLAKTHHVPVVVACHTRRIDPAQVPKLSDAANSAGIERKARIVLGLSRAPDSTALKITVLKQTNGVAGMDVDIEFVKQFAMVYDDGSHAKNVYGDGVSA